jgi:glycosyltransferase involved in cell wall biosynthesis
MGVEVRFLTGLYYRPERFPYSMVRWLPAGRRRRLVELLEKRRIEGLSPDNIVSLLGPVLEMTLRPFGFTRFWNLAHDWLASRWISRAPATSGATILHCFQGSCLRALRAAKPKRMLRLLEVTLPPLTDPASLERWQLDSHDFPDPAALRAELAETDFVLAQSEYSVQALLDLGVPQGRILRLHLGVDTGHFRPRVGERRPGPLRILFVGPISRRKGVHHLLRAWKELGLEHAELLLAGNIRSPRAGELIQQAPPGCRILGHVPDSQLLSLLQQADLLVHPSLGEGGCNAVYEALACGLACIVSSHAGSAVRHEIEGLVVEPGDIGGLKAAMERLSADPELRRQMGTAARQRAERLTLDCFAARLGAIYRALGDCAGGGPAGFETHF